MIEAGEAAPGGNKTGRSQAGELLARAQLSLAIGKPGQA